MKITNKEKKINQLVELVDGLTYEQFRLLIQQAEIFYSHQQSLVQLNKESLKMIKENCERRITE